MRVRFFEHFPLKDEEFLADRSLARSLAGPRSKS